MRIQNITKPKTQNANDDFRDAVTANLWDDPIALRNQQIAIQTMTQQLCVLLTEPNYFTLPMYVRTLDVVKKRKELEDLSITDVAMRSVKGKSNLSAKQILDNMPKLAGRRFLL